MVSRNYDMSGSESSEIGSGCRGSDFVGTMRNDLQRSSRRSVTETSGTVRHGRFQYLGDRPLELTDSLKGYNRGASTDAIYRVDNESLDCWQVTKRKCRAARWLFLLLAALLVVGIVIYFLVIDMKVMAPVLTGSPEDQQVIDQLKAVISEVTTDDVVTLNGDVILDVDQITYIEGQFHITKEPNTTVSGTESPLNSSHQNTIEIVQVPSLGTTRSGTSDIYKESLFTSGTNVPQSNGISTTRAPSDVTLLQTNNFSPTFDAKFFYPTSKLYNKPTVQQDEQANNTGSATALPLIRKGNRTNNKIAGNESRKNQVTPPLQNPVSPTLPSSTHVRHDISEILHQNETESLCFSPHLTMCRGTLPYDLTTLPLLPGVSKLADLDTALPYFELIVESGCSARARQFVCPILEPECRPKGETLLPPCRKACKAVAEECADFILATLDLSQVFHCDLYPDTDDPTKCVNWARGETCMANEFHCPDGTCIPTRWQCDGVSDCLYAADEMNCTQCKNGGFRCDRDDTCIPFRWRCDGQQDCSDGLDEVNCPTQEECHAEDFKCRDSGYCIPSLLRCNGVSDCTDSSDEENCKIIKTHQLTAMPHTSPCPAGELRCLDGRCIILQQLCDGKEDCSDGADEVNCSIGV